MVELAKVRKELLTLAFIYMEKIYNRVNRKKTFEAMRGYGVQHDLVDVIENIYDRSMLKFKMLSIMTRCCKSDSGVRCLHYIYVR